MHSTEKNLKKDGAGKARRLIRLFLSTLYISAFTFGGGFVIVTLLKRKFVDEYHWIEEDEMLDITAMAQSSPGAIAVNAGMLVGWKVAGLPGMITAVLGTVIPPLIILSVLSFFYAAFSSNRYVILFLQGMKAGVAAVLVDVVLTLGAKVIKEKNVFYDLITVAAFVLAFFTDINVVLIILGAALIGTVYALIVKAKKKEEKKE